MIHSQRFIGAVFGAPYSGKTFLGELLSTAAGIQHLHFHAMCEQELSHRSREGLAWKRHTDRSERFPLGLANAIFFKHANGKDRFLADGFPKRQDEIDLFVESFPRIDAVILLDVSPSILRLRHGHRRQCARCWSLVFADENEDLKCCKCGSDVLRGSETNEEFESRLADFCEYGEDAFSQIRSISTLACRATSAAEAGDILLRFIAKI
jgi:adenylate kinase family enzyme